MKTLILDLNKLSSEELQAYLMLEKVSESHVQDEKIKDANQIWMKEKKKPVPDIPEFNVSGAKTNEIIS
jgi:hypothetical protein